MPPERVQTQLAANKGGADVLFDEKGNRIGGSRLLSVVTLRAGESGRFYRIPNESDYQVIWKAQERLNETLAIWEQKGNKELCPVPDEPTPSKDTHRAVGSQITLYGIMCYGDLFTSRQKLSLITLTRLTALLSANSISQKALALALTRAANAGCSLCRWHTTGEKHEGVYSRQALPLVWDYCEGNPLSSATGGYAGALEWVRNVVKAWPRSESG